MKIFVTSLGPEINMTSENNKSNFGLPDMTALSESERLQVLAVMQRAKVNNNKSSLLHSKRIHFWRNSKIANIQVYLFFIIIIQLFSDS